MKNAIQSNREPHVCTTSGVHQRIVEELSQQKKAFKADPWACCEAPAIDSLMASAKDAIQRGMPSNFEHGGHTYWLRFSAFIGMLDVFDSATACLPLIAGMTDGVGVLGHSPRPVVPHAQNLPASFDESGLISGQLDQVRPPERALCTDWAALVAKGATP